MLIKFSSNAAGSFSMFGEDAMVLVKLMTGTGQQEGAVRGRAIGESLSRLREGIKGRKPPAVEEGDDSDDEEHDEPVQLSARAMPLLEMLEKAAAKAGDPDTYVMWQPE